MRGRSSPLWIVKKGIPQALGYNGLYRLIKRLKRRTGLKKPLRPNYLRHASLTEWAKILPEQKLKVLAGWTPSSGMAAVYIHLAGKDLDEDILKAQGKKLMEPEKLGPSPLAPKACWRCGHENAPTHRFCARCGVVLTRKQASKMVERETMPLDTIIASEKTEIIEFLKALTKEELQIVISDFFNPLKGELKELRKQIHTEYKEVNRSLEELRAVKREVDKRLSESFT